MADMEALRVVVDIRVDVRNPEAGYGNLSIRQDFDMPAASFPEMAKILGQFHDLAEKIKRERSGGNT